jgi:tRNA(Ile)-lysidine synthase
LLLLATAARPGRIEAATVDHGLRLEGRDEAVVVEQICRGLDVPHATLSVAWREVPSAAIQERARHKRYQLLGYWTEERNLAALVTAHHADDQAETFLMRLRRGSGVRGLSAMRPRSFAPASHVRLLRPLLGWRRSELATICAQANLTPATDRSNGDEQFERVRLRKALARSEWLDPVSIARSAAHLADADAALDWAVQMEWNSAVHEKRDLIIYARAGAPREIVRRIISKAVRRLATEGEEELRGRELDHLLATLSGGRIATVRGVRCDGTNDWRFTPAPPRRD